MESLFGLLGAFTGVAIFICGYYFGKESAKVKTPKYEASDEEMKQIQLEREQLIKEQEAFKNLMSYNADMAYGVAANPLK